MRTKKDADNPKDFAELPEDKPPMDPDAFVENVLTYMHANTGLVLQQSQNIKGLTELYKSMVERIRALEDFGLVASRRIEQLEQMLVSTVSKQGKDN